MFVKLKSYSQSINEHHFKYTGKCNLTNAINTFDKKGNKVSVYQFIVKTPTVTIYRVNVISFKENITDTNEYFRSLKSEYSKLGSVSTTTINGMKALQVREKVDIQGYSMKQISISTLYKNKSITLVLVSNSPEYESLLLDFQSKISFL